ncbi:MAG: YkvA family protein [Pseudomonadota bacterium]
MEDKSKDYPLDVEILGPEEQREEKVRAGFWPTFKKAASRIPFSDEVVASYYCALDPKTPNRVRFLLLAALAYFVVPLDTVPDFILGLGFGDDIAVLSTALAAVRGSITDAHRDAAREALSDETTAEGETDSDKSAA